MTLEISNLPYFQFTIATASKLFCRIYRRRYVLFLMPCIVGATAGCDHADSIDDGCDFTSRPEMINRYDFGSRVPSPSTNSFLLCRVDSDLLGSNTLWSVDIRRRADDTMIAVPRCGTISDIKAAYSATGACGTESQSVTEHSEMFSIYGSLLTVTWIGDFNGNYYDVRICRFRPLDQKKINAPDRDIFASAEYELCYDRTFNNVTDVVMTRKSGDCVIIVYGDMDPCSEGREEVSFPAGEELER